MNETTKWMGNLVRCSNHDISHQAEFWLEFRIRKTVVLPGPKPNLPRILNLPAQPRTPHATTEKT